MKVIDLLNKIANGEEVPKKIKYEGIEYTHIDNYCYADKNGRLLSYEIYAEQHRLNDEIEIIEDTPKENKKLEKLESLNTDYFMERKKYGTLTNEEIVLDIQTLKNYINKLVDKENGE